VFVQPTKAGHSRGRFNYNSFGVSAWKLYTTPSPLIPNPQFNFYSDYLAKPVLVPLLKTSTLNVGTSKSNTGFFAIETQQMIFKYNDQKYDSTGQCVAIYYTTNGDYPRPDPLGLNPTSSTKLYTDTNNPVLIDATTIVRAIAVLRTTSSTASPAPVLVCPTMTNYLESFCETNTYFIGTEHNSFKNDFGVVSIALDYADSSWFTLQGNPPSTTIHVEYYDKKNHITEGYGVINRPVNESWQTKQKGFSIEIDDRNGFGCNFEAPIFNVDSLGSSQRKIFPMLNLYAGDIESNSPPLVVPNGSATTAFGTGLRDIFIQTLAAKYKLNVNPLHYKPVITFINGKYYGLWNFKEVFDKYYEEYYNNQSRDSVDMCFYHNGEGSVNYRDGSISNYNHNFKATVYDKANVAGISSTTNYTTLTKSLDIKNFIDYMILQSFFMNSDVWNYNVAFAKGNRGVSGSKYHYYLWNMPAVLNFTKIATNNMVINNVLQSPCVYDNTSYPLSLRAYNAPGLIHAKLMNTTNNTSGNPQYQLEYKNRYQDLLNGALSCENLKKHYTYIYGLYRKEMRCHEDPACAAGGTTPFTTVPDNWDTNVYNMSVKLYTRCDFVAGAFTKYQCYGITGPKPITVRVEPEGAGNVKVNSLTLDTYPWTGNYYATLMSFKATSTNTNVYVFYKWKFQNHTPKDPLTSDSVGVNMSSFDDVTAVFTDKTRDITNGGDSPNVPTAFSPNGDGQNDYFKPLGSAEYVTDYEFTIWNRWGQRVYVSNNPRDAGWDGNYQGQQAVIGVYAYIIVYKNSSKEDKVLKGNVTLTR
jgi:gliding motility-associated-like protein